MRYPLHEPAVNLFQQLNAPAWKRRETDIASFGLGDASEAARKLLKSTGVASWVPARRDVFAPALVPSAVIGYQRGLVERNLGPTLSAAIFGGDGSQNSRTEEWFATAAALEMSRNDRRTPEPISSLLTLEAAKGLWDGDVPKLFDEDLKEPLASNAKELGSGVRHEIALRLLQRREIRIACGGSRIADRLA